MKKFLSLVMLILPVCLTHAQGIYIYKSNGEVVRYLNAEVDSIVAYPTDLGEMEAVDLGLSVRWAAMNIGAGQMTDCGNYYSWGDVEDKSVYTETACRLTDIGFTSLQSRGIIDQQGNLQPRYDVARQTLGGTWRMPTSAEFAELRRQCQWQWTELHDTWGYKITGPTGESIFLPAAGYKRDGQHTGVREIGYYWSSTAYHDYSSAESLYFYEGFVDWYNDNRYIGLPVRPVAE